MGFKLEPTQPASHFIIPLFAHLLDCRVNIFASIPFHKISRAGFGLLQQRMNIDGRDLTDIFSSEYFRRHFIYRVSALF